MLLHKELTSVSRGRIILTNWPNQQGAGRLERASNSEPPEEKSCALLTELPPHSSACHSHGRLLLEAGRLLVLDRKKWTETIKGCVTKQGKCKTIGVSCNALDVCLFNDL